MTVMAYGPPLTLAELAKPLDAAVGSALNTSAKVGSVYTLPPLALLLRLNTSAETNVVPYTLVPLAATATVGVVENT